MNPYIVAAFFFTGFVSGYYVRDLEADREQLVIERKNVTKLIEAKKTADRLEQELINARKKRKVIYRTIIREIDNTMPQKQTNDSVCNLTNRTLRMLQRVSMSYTSSELAPADSETSEVREADIIKYLLSAMQQYNKARSQCNLLIQWHTQK